MGKASRKNKKSGNVFYAYRKGVNTLYKIYAETEEDAIIKANEKFGEDNWVMGQGLPHAKSKAEVKHDQKIAEDVAGRLLGPAGRAAMETMHHFDNIMK